MLLEQHIEELRAEMNHCSGAGTGAGGTGRYHGRAGRFR